MTTKLEKLSTQPSELRIFLAEWKLPFLFASAIAAVYLALLLAAGGGALALPLDDAYIYFQYARQMAGGHAFQFNTGDPLSTGATSLLYQAWLALWYKAGWTGGLLAWAAFLTAWACLVSSFFSLRRLAARWAPPVRPALVMALLAGCGPLMAGYFSGLELALFGALLLAGLEAHADAPDHWKGPLWFALLAFTRPEGQIAAACFGLAAPAKRGQTPSRYSRAWALLLPWALLPSLFQFLLTGSTFPDSLSPKTPLLKPGLDAAAQALASLDFLIGAVKGVFLGAFGSAESVGYMGGGDAGNGVAGYFMPLALLFFLLGVSARLARAGKKWAGDTWAPLLAWMVLGLLAVALALPVGWHRHRYLQPFYIPFILGLSLAAGELKAASLKTPPALWPRAAAGAFWALALGFGALSFSQQALLTFESARNYRGQHAAIARELSRRVPAGTRVAAVDVGILAYESGLPIQDLAGVTDHRLAAEAQRGVGALVETFLSWPAGARPVLAVLQEGRPDMNPAAFLGARLLKPLAFIGHPQTGTRMGIYAWDWQAGPASTPGPDALAAMGRGAVMVDEVNVALPAGERAHGYRAFGRGAQTPGTVAARFPLGPGGPWVLDPGRLVFAGESFALWPGSTGRTWLVARLKSGPPAVFHLRAVSGSRSGGYALDFGGRGEAFEEITMELPQPEKPGDAFSVKAFAGPGPNDLSLDAQRPYGSYHYWLYQETGEKKQGR